MEKKNGTWKAGGSSRWRRRQGRLPNLLDKDFDNDGLTDDIELKHGANPTKIDTDNDGLSDYDEVNTFFTDPSKANMNGDLWHDSVDHHPLNVFIGIPILGFLALGVVFRKKIVSYLKNVRKGENKSS